MPNKLNRKRGFRDKALLASAAVLVVAAPVLIGSILPARSNAQTSADEKASSQSAGTSLQFEVASIRRSDLSRSGFGQRLTYSPGRYAGERVSLAILAWNAYGIKEAYQIEWASPWMASELYDIAAKVPDGATIEQVHIMLQRLLAECFALVVHQEARQLPGFRLVVAKGGAKLRRSVDAPTVEVSGPSIVNMNGITQFANNAKSGVLLTIKEEQLHGRHETMGGLAHYLVQVLHTPVIDATGIEGEYDYDLSFEPIVAPPPKGTVFLGLPGAGAPTDAAGPPSAPAPGDHPTVFTAIKELGLQLESVKSTPVEVLVLDKASPDPTEN